MFIVAVLDRLPESVTRTRKLLVPTLAEKGVPDNAPLLATVSQAGPLTFAKVIASPLASVAFVAIVPEYGCPAFAAGLLNGLLTNAGGELVISVAISSPLNARL